MEYPGNSLRFPPFLLLTPALLFNGSYSLKELFSRPSSFLHTRPPQ